MNRFENKVVVITGAAGGIGEATTRRIVSEGGKVVIADHSEKKAEQLANELTHAGADVRHVYFSATELQSCKELIDFSMNEYQRIDVLINNVGGTDPKRDLNIEKLDINYFDEAFHLNLCCTMYLSQQVIPIMTTNGGGNIVNVASISGLTADANGTLYGASKAGVINLTKYMYSNANRDFIPLGEEVEYIDQYIALQTLRLNGFAEVRFDRTVEHDAMSVPPMLLITFVENAFKYGISSNEPCFVRIRLRQQGSTLRFEVENSVFGRESQNSKRMGIANCRKRLALLYPDRHRLETGTDADGLFRVRLEIQSPAL